MEKLYSDPNYGMGNETRLTYWMILVDLGVDDGIGIFLKDYFKLTQRSLV